MPNTFAAMLLLTWLRIHKQMLPCHLLKVNLHIHHTQSKKTKCETLDSLLSSDFKNIWLNSVLVRVASVGSVLNFSYCILYLTLITKSRPFA